MLIPGDILKDNSNERPGILWLVETDVAKSIVTITGYAASLKEIPRIASCLLN